MSTCIVSMGFLFSVALNICITLEKILFVITTTIDSLLVKFKTDQLIHKMDVKYSIAFVILICLQVGALNANDADVSSNHKTVEKCCSPKNSINLWKKLLKTIGVLTEIVKEALSDCECETKERKKDYESKSKQRQKDSESKSKEKKKESESKSKGGNKDGGSTSSDKKCRCNCDDIRYIRAPDPVYAKMVLYDICEFDCVKKLYPNLKKTPCPRGTKSPGRSYSASDKNCLCGCNEILYKKAPEPVCACITFGDGCHYSCINKRYLDVTSCESVNTK